MVGRTSDVYIETHYRDGAAVPVAKSFQKMSEEIKKTEAHAKTASKEFATFGKVIGGLVTIEMAKKLAMFTVEITRMSTAGAAAVSRLDRSWRDLENTIGTVLSKPLSGGFVAGSKVLDGFAVQLEAVGVLYHKIFGGMADTPTIDRLAGIKTTAIGPKAELAKQIRQAQFDEKLNGIGAQVDEQVAQDQEKKKQEQEKQHQDALRLAETQHQDALRLAEKQQKDFLDLAHRLGPGTIGRNMGMSGGRPTLLAAMLDPGSGAAKKAADLSGQSAYLVGGKTGEQLSLGLKHGLQTNKQDFTNPAANMAVAVAESFRTSFVDILSQSYTDLLAGDFTDAITGIGTGLFTSVETGFTDELAKQTVDSKLGKKLTGYVSDGTTAAVKGIGGIVSSGLDASFDVTRMQGIGSKAGHSISQGLSAGFDWVMPDIGKSWGPEGATFQAIKGGMSDALKGGIEGAAIGSMIAMALGSSELTTKYTQIGASIGGAIGGALAGPTGSGIGSLIGSIGGQVWQTGASKQQEGDYKNLLTDVAAFGGAKGFFSRIGGLSGFTGKRKGALGGSGAGDFATLLRLTEGVTEEQANWFTQFLRGDNVYLSQGDENQVLNVMRSLGFSEEDVALAGKKITSGVIQDIIPAPGATYPGIAAGGSTPDPAGPLGATHATVVPFSPVVSAPPPVQPASMLSPDARMASLLTAMIQNNAISRSALQSLGASVIDSATGKMGGIWPSFAPHLKGVAAAAGWSMDEAWMSSRGIDVVAAQGFVGTVNRPTRFLAGEAGPEDVMVIPQGMRRGITGGSSGRGGAQLNITMQINTPNVETTREWARREFYPMIRSMLMEDSNNGVPILRSRGVVQG